MKLMTRVLTLLLLVLWSAWGAWSPAPAAAQSASLWDTMEQVVEPSEAKLCEPVPGKRFVCLDVERTGHGYPTVTACLYDETLKILMPWFSGVGQLACLETHHWAYLGTPGACFGVGPNGNPMGCVADDRGFDDDDDGDIDRYKHCVVWVAGYSLCWV